MPGESRKGISEDFFAKRNRRIPEAFPRMWETGLVATECLKVENLRNLKLEKRDQIDTDQETKRIPTNQEPRKRNHI